MLSFSQMKDLVVESFKDWNEDKAPRLAAALAYYTIFSLAPLLIIVIAIAGLAFGEQTARDEVITQIRSVMGDQGADTIAGLLEASDRRAAGTLAAIIGFATLLFGAAGVFGQLKGALNTIWEVAPKPDRGLWGLIRDNLLSFTMVLGVGFLLLVSLLISTAISAVGKYLAGDSFDQSWIWQIVNFIVQAAITFGLFALIFKELPDAEISWRDVIIGAAVTTLLFAIGRYLISLYLAHTATASTFGAAGSLVIILIWIYFSAQILFLGAEITQVYARHYGSHIRPTENAVPVTQEQRAEQGMPEPEVLAATAAIAEGRTMVRPEQAPAGATPVQEHDAAWRAPERGAPAAEQRSSLSGTVLAGAVLASVMGAIAVGVVRRRAS